MNTNNMLIPVNDYPANKDKTNKEQLTTEPAGNSKSGLYFIIIILFLLISGSIKAQEIYTDNRFIIKIMSAVLNEERTVYISLPSDYFTTDESYPVHYVLDGEATFDFYASAVNLLAMQGQIPRAIVAGITNNDRDRDFMPSDSSGDPAGGSPFYLFLTTELVPYIKDHYRAAPFTVLAGHSLTGFFVIDTFISHPQAFSAYIAGSPYLEPLADRLKNNSLPDLTEPQKFLYVSTGSEEDKTSLEYQLLLKKNLQKSKTADDLRYEVVVNKGRNHNTNGLVNFIDGNLFIFSRFGEYRLPSDPSLFNVDDLYNYAGQLSKEYGFKVNIPEDFLVFLGNEMIRFKKYDDARKISRIIHEQFPASDKGYIILYNSYVSRGMEKEAMEIKAKYNLKD